MVQDVIAPEMVLGKTVLAADGARLGAVEDVGLVNRRRVKFLVVVSGGPSAAVRVNADDVDHIDDAVVTLRPT